MACSCCLLLTAQFCPVLLWLLLLLLLSLRTQTNAYACTPAQKPEMEPSNKTATLQFRKVLWARFALQKVSAWYRPWCHCQQSLFWPWHQAVICQSCPAAIQCISCQATLHSTAALYRQPDSKQHPRTNHSHRCGQVIPVWPKQTMSDIAAGTYVRFQPRSADFQEALGEVMEHALQASMFTHSTLTEGEWVQIAHEGTTHDVKVLALQPEAAVSVIGNSLTAQDCCLGPDTLVYHS